MKKLIAIGEALIDFVSNEVNIPLSKAASFKGNIGGAPANVCGAYTKLGLPAAMITKLGEDAFGDRIVEELDQVGIDTSLIGRTDQANTCLAFVSLRSDGNRDFAFYRKPSADMLLSPEDIDPACFEDSYALHFCSVALGSENVREAHKKSISCAVENGAVISFDPNIRLPLWKDHDELKNTISEFIPYAHILKISDEELEFITGCKTIEEAKDILFRGNVKLVIYTKGSEGADAYTLKYSAHSDSKKVKPVDTTGAGDAFIGSFLFQCAKKGFDAQAIGELGEEELKELLDFSNKYCAYSVLSNGAIASYATFDEIMSFEI